MWTGIICGVSCAKIPKVRKGMKIGTRRRWMLRVGDDVMQFLLPSFCSAALRVAAAVRPGLLLQALDVIMVRAQWLFPFRAYCPSGQAGLQVG